METRLLGLHHVTAITGNVKNNVAFYRDTLGLRLVKRTVNYDDPGSYHLYFGDDRGNPGTIVTFFDWPGIRPGRAGDGDPCALALSAPLGSEDFWVYRLKKLGIPFQGPFERFGEPVISLKDPDGMAVELVADAPQDVGYGWPGGPVAPSLTIRGLHSVTLLRRDIGPTQDNLEQILGIQAVKAEGNRKRFQAGIKFVGIWVDVVVDSSAQKGLEGAGSIHHLAFRASSAPVQHMWREDLVSVDVEATPVVDRTYFKSIYFREPGGTLFEIATDDPGFEVDEPRERLGAKLMLPAHLEAQRPAIEAQLPPWEEPPSPAEAEQVA